MTTTASASRLPMTPTKSVRDRIANLEAGQQSPPPKSPVSPRRTSILGRSGLPRLADKARKLSISAKTSSESVASNKTPSPAPIPSVSPTSNSETLVEVKLEHSPKITTPPIQATTLSIDKSPFDTSLLPANGSPSASPHLEEVDVLQPSDSTLPVETVPSSSVNVNLDDLLSPDQPTSKNALFATSTEKPEDQTGDEEEEGDNVRFSTVPLSGKSFDGDGNVQISASSSVRGDDVEDLRLETTATRLDITGGLVEIVSPTTLTFLKNRLEKQDDHHDLSVGASERLQVQFAQLQTLDSEKEAEAIDWGGFHTLPIPHYIDYFLLLKTFGELSWQVPPMLMVLTTSSLILFSADYHQFARDHSEELARAIESGIPNSLRGMLWQLM